MGPLGIYLLCGSRAWSARWWCGTLVAIAGNFTVAAGALTLPAFIALALMQVLAGQRSGRGECLAIACHAIIAALLLWDLPSVPAHAANRAQSLAEWLNAVMVLASWPVVTASWPAPLRVAGALALFAPVLLVAGRLRERPPVTDWRWLYLGLAAWVGMLILAFAYGRAAGAFYGSRYHDVFIVGLVLNAASLIWLLRDSPFAARRGLRAGAAVWMLAVMVAAGQKATNNVPRDIAGQRNATAVQIRNVTQFLATGDKAAIENKPRFDIPYSESAKLLRLLSLPQIVAILKPALAEPPPLQRAMLQGGPMLLPVGLALLMIAALPRRRPRASGS